MRHLATALLTLASVCCAHGAAEPVKAPISVISTMLPREADANGDTLLIRFCRMCISMPEAQRTRLIPLITLMIESGADPLQENKQGCNAMFYINGMPVLRDKLAAECRLPRELTLRLPHDEMDLRRYMRLRTAQIQYADTPGSRDYMLRRYCEPAYERADALFRHYMSRESLRDVPQGGMGDCLNFMRVTRPEATCDYINGLNLWEHGEHFLEEIPHELLRELHRLNWPVAPAKIRMALHKLHTLLPTSKEDMIDCYAAAPMVLLLEMLISQDGHRAMADLKRCSTAFEPELRAASLRLQIRLMGLTPPDEVEQLPENAPAQLTGIRNTLLADTAIRKCDVSRLTPEILRSAADTCRAHGMPLRAAMMIDMIEGEQLSVSEATLPILSTAYAELKENTPAETMLRFLLSHQQLLKAVPNP